jgi:hypothetical protein
VEGSGGSGSSWKNQFGYDGGNNIANDPGFKYNSLSLQDNSPAIGKGDNAAYWNARGLSSFANEKDLDGNPRLSGLRIDLGAYEYQLSAATANDYALSDNNAIYGGSPKSVTVTPKAGAGGITVSGLHVGTMLYIYNMTGQLVYSQRVDVETRLIASLPTGAYIIVNDGRRAKAAL